MGDSTAMTIEFLRARLLSERAVSRAAKERADQLEKRVVELEEQLRNVTSQRKKAERAAMEAFSVLEAHGIDGLSEVVDSSSDKDECSHDEKGSNESFKEEDTSTASKTERIEIEDAFSSSEPGDSPSQAGSLSWKWRSNSPDLQKKLKAKQFRQRQRRISLISSIESTPKYNLGKSCRKIKRKEMGSASEDEAGNHVILDANGQRQDARPDSADDQPDLSVEVSGSESCSIDAENKEADSGHYAIGREGNEEMERVLEQQAQLIGQYEAEEKAQRDWEEKYNETKSSNLEILDLENKCHVAENMQPEKEANVVLDIVPYEEKEAELNSEALSNTMRHTGRGLSDVPVLKTSDCKIEDLTAGDQDATTRAFSNGIVLTNLTSTTSRSKSYACRDGLLSQIHNEAANETDRRLLQIAFPAKGCNRGPVANQTPDLAYKFSESGSSNDIRLHTHGNRVLASPSIGNPVTSDVRSNMSKLRPSVTHVQPQMISRTASSNLGDVLESLQKAKMSLRLEFQKPQLPEQSSLALVPSTDYCVGNTTSGETLNIPMSSASLFRLPTDAIPPSESSDRNIHGSGLSSGAIYPNMGCATSVKYNQHPTTSCKDSGFDDPMGKKYSDACDPAMGITISNRCSLPYSDLTNGVTPFSRAFGVSMLGKKHYPSYSPATGSPAASRYSLPIDMITERTFFPNRDDSSMLKQYPDANHLGMGIPSFNRYPVTYLDLASDTMLFSHGISKPDRTVFQDGILRNDGGTFT